MPAGSSRKVRSTQLTDSKKSFQFCSEIVRRLRMMFATIALAVLICEISWFGSKYFCSPKKLRLKNGQIWRAFRTNDRYQ